MTTKSQLPHNSCFAHDDGIQVYWAKGDTCPLCLAYEADDISQPQQSNPLQRVYLNPTDIGVTRRWFDKQHPGMGEVAYVREQNQVEAEASASTPQGKVPESNTLLLADLERIEAYCAAASRGPWTPEGSQIARRVNPATRGFNDNMIVRDAAILRQDENFIANARTDLPKLVAELRRRMESEQP